MIFLINIKLFFPKIQMKEGALYEKMKDTDMLFSSICCIFLLRSL